MGCPSVQVSLTFLIIQHGSRGQSLGKVSSWCSSGYMLSVIPWGTLGQGGVCRCVRGTVSIFLFPYLFLEVSHRVQPALKEEGS